MFGLAEIDAHLERTDQIFSYYHWESMLHFNTSLLARIRKQLPSQFRLIEILLTDAEYSLCMNHRGIEEPKVAALKGKDLREPGYSILTGTASNGIPDHIIVDGHHRLVRRYRGGIRTMKFWVCFPNIWSACLMPATPEEEAQIAATLPPRVADVSNTVSRVKFAD